VTVTQLTKLFSSLNSTELTESESHVTTDRQSASTLLGLRPDLYYCLTISGLLIWGALSDERTGLPFAIATGPRQRSLSRVQVPWDLRPYFTASHLRLPFWSPPTTRRVTLEVFDPASTRVAELTPLSAYNISARTPQRTPFQEFYCCVTKLLHGPRRRTPLLSWSIGAC
jgi:hypothetical protein